MSGCVYEYVWIEEGGVYKYELHAFYVSTHVNGYVRVDVVVEYMSWFVILLIDLLTYFV